MAASDLTAQRLREVLNYDPETGIFTRAEARPGAFKGSVAGTPHSRGYWSININRHIYLAHRLAWLHVHGEWPASQIDHINGIRTDNRIANLRQATSALNNQNQRTARSDNKASGLLGVFYNNGRWASRLQLGGKRHNLGSFSTPEEAHAAYIEAKRLMHPGCTI